MTFLGIALATCGPAGAAPWVDPGDPALRGDIELLSDAGLLTAPVTTWPLSWGDIARDLENADVSVLRGEQEQSALLRLRRAMQLNTSVRQVRRELSLRVSSDPRPLRTFEDTPRERGELRAGVEWTGLRFAYRLRLTTVTDPSDDRIGRGDGSYIGVALGNYMLSVGQLERWWGPGWHGGLILSNNARPVPAVALRRNFSTAPTSRWLRWLGPWTWTTFMGQLENGRFVPDALLFGARLNFRPIPSLELGLSRTAQWCGSGRPCDLSTLADLLIGRDNRGENTELENEPGNQLAGLDWRWKLPSRLHLAWYGQFIGEDEAGNLPSRYIGLTGMSWRAGRRLPGGHWSAQLELADTAAEFYTDPVRYDYTYEHFIYRDGYRYRDRSIGHAMDNDGFMVSLGLNVRTDSDRQWRGLMRRVELNRGGTWPNPVAAVATDLWNLELTYGGPLGAGRFDLGLGLDWLDTVDGGSDSDVRFHASWASEL